MSLKELIIFGTYRENPANHKIYVFLLWQKVNLLHYVHCTSNKQDDDVFFSFFFMPQHTVTAAGCDVHRWGRIIISFYWPHASHVPEHLGHIKHATVVSFLDACPQITMQSALVAAPPDYTG